MFRPAIVFATLITVALGCSKKSDSTTAEEGGDPNATYTLTFREMQKGDKHVVVKAREGVATIKTQNSTQTKKEDFRYEFTETILDTSPDEKLPTKVTRVYKTADRLDPAGKKASASFVGKTVNIERFMKGYKYCADGKVIPGLEQQEIADDFLRGGWKVSLLLPKEPVKVGQSWEVDFASITAIGGNPQTKYDKEKSKFTAKLTRVYQKDGARWGTIEAKIVLVMATGAKAPPVTGSVETDTVTDLVVDGSATAGKQRMTLKGTLEARDPIAGVATTTIEGNEERSITPVK
jgi:hypothetical protein